VIDHLEIGGKSVTYPNFTGLLTMEHKQPHQKFDNLMQDSSFKTSCPPVCISYAAASVIMRFRDDGKEEVSTGNVVITSSCGISNLDKI
jgi:hypothetical protein